MERNGVDCACTSLVHHGPGSISRAPDESLLPYRTFYLSGDSNPVRRCEWIIGDEDAGEGTQTREGDLGAGERLPQHEPRWGLIIVHQGQPTPRRAAAVGEAGRRSTNFQPPCVATREADGVLADWFQSGPSRAAGDDPWAAGG